MKATGMWVGASLVVVMSAWSAARASSLDIAALSQRVLDACPAYWEDVYYWNTPTEVCLDGRTDVKCVPYSEWSKAWSELRS